MLNQFFQLYHQLITHSNLNNMYHTKFIICIIILFFQLSCQENLDLSEYNKKNTVVICLFSPQNPWVLQLKESKISIHDNTFGAVPIKDANISITNEAGNEVPEFLYYYAEDTLRKINFYSPSLSSFDGPKYRVEDGFYISTNEKPVAEIPYNLSVKVEGRETIVAKASPIPKAVKIGDVEILNETTRQFSIEFEDDSDVENFYHLKIYGLNTSFNKTYFAYSITSEIENANGLSGKHGYLLNDKEQNGQLIKLIITANLNEAYHLPLPDSETETGGYIIELRTVSKEYYSFFMDLEKQLDYASQDFIDSDGTQNLFEEPLQVFSNIKNGYGIFAGYNSDIKILD